MTALAAVALPAQSLQPLQTQAPHIRIELVPDREQPQPGSSMTLALVATPESGWHGYWQNPGDAGVPTLAHWTLPPGMSAGPLRYPVPERLPIAGLMNYGYAGSFAQLVTLKLPPQGQTGEKLPIGVKLDYLVCSSSLCVPESQTLSTTLSFGDGAIPPERRLQFARWQARIPQQPPVAATFTFAGGMLRLAVPLPPGAQAGYFYPLTEGAFDYAAPQQLTMADGSLLVTVKAAKAPTLVEGVLALGDGQGLAVRAVPGPAPVAATGFDWAVVLAALAGAVLGGVILNVMPCVFPILSLKALSLARGTTSSRAARQEGLAYTAGAMAMCLALGGALLALRAGGAKLGWAFQLTDPRMILLLLLLVTAIACNLAGLFELNTPGAVNRWANHSSGAFATGALAAFIATPCAGPFMATALGAALVLPWGAGLAVFAGLGLGLGLPFLALGLVPGLRRLLPKPGVWMVRFRRWLALPMALTALLPLWVLERQAGFPGMALGLAAALVLVLALWWGGVRQGRGQGWLPLLPVLAAAVATAALVRPAPPTPMPMTAFSETRLAALRAEKRPVFVYFTADWCIICKLNEQGVIETTAVQQAFRRHKIAVLVGDWTSGDQELGRFLEAQGRAGVPLYLWYAPGEARPQVLPQLLTPALLTERAAATGAS